MGWGGNHWFDMFIGNLIVGGFNHGSKSVLYKYMLDK